MRRPLLSDPSPVAHESAAAIIRKREALEELLQSDGWHFYKHYVLAKYRGDGYVARMAAALDTTDPSLAAKVVHQTSLEALRDLDWPANQVRDLKGVVD